MLCERIYFIMEGLDVIMIDLDSDLKKEILNLRRELDRVHEYLTWFDARDEEPSLSDQTFFMEMDALAHSFDDILFHFTNEHNWRQQRIHCFCFDMFNIFLKQKTNVISCDFHHLVQKTVQSYQAVQLQPTFIFNNGNNINTGAHAQQITGSTTVTVSISPNNLSNIRRISRPKSYGHVRDCGIVGFTTEFETLLGYLKQLEHGNTHVVGIVGMGGSGKTTLAKQVYHHPNIKTHFHPKVWVCISQSWNRRDIICDMLRQAKGLSIYDSKQKTDAEIFEELSKLLSSLSYLVVVDDMWDMNAWYDISPALPPSEGSKVIITTRKAGIPKVIDPAVLILKPEPLNATESYELFHRITFLDENPSHMLIKLGKKMVNRCRGLPLSITALAGILRMDKSESRWRRISETLMQKILNTADSSQGVVKEVLEMSYCDLPYYLKPCVLYLGIFPEDYTVRAELLMQMWIAECLIRCPGESKESIAEEYLEEMIQRCIIQDVKVNDIGQVMSFQCHDLIREMCVDVAKKKGFLKDSHRISSSFTTVLEPEKSSHVRSLISLYHPVAKLSVELPGLFQKFMLLRVLILRHISYREERVIPEAIGNLIHLRYLELVDRSYRQLPSTIGNLQNLWTLNLNGLFRCTFMPNIFWKLKDLRHLYLPYGYNVGESRGVMNLHRLQKLKTLWEATGGEWMSSEMPILSPALQKLQISEIESEEQLKAVLCTPSILSNNLQTLDLNWHTPGNIILKDMNNLSKCESLRELVLEGGIRSRPVAFPPNLVKLELCYTFLRDVMSIIDKCCPQLKILILGEYAFMGDKLVSNANSFQQLEKLELLRQFDLERWTIERGAMSNLKVLVLELSNNLELTPEGREFISKVPEVNYPDWEEFLIAKDPSLWRHTPPLIL